MHQIFKNMQFAEIYIFSVKIQYEIKQVQILKSGIALYNTGILIF